MLCTAAKQVIACLRQISEALNMCTTRIETTIDSCYIVQLAIEQLIADGSGMEDFSSIPLRSALDITSFNGAMSKLENLPEHLTPVTSTIRKRLEMLQVFASDGPAEVHSCFQLPFPASIVQKSLIGEEPPMKLSLLQQLGLMQSLDLGYVLEVVDTLSDSVAALNIEIAVDPVREFTEKAVKHLDRLDVVLCEAGLGYAVIDSKIAQRGHAKVLDTTLQPLPHRTPGMPSMTTPALIPQPPAHPIPEDGGLQGADFTVNEINLDHLIDLRSPDNASHLHRWSSSDLIDLRSPKRKAADSPVQPLAQRNGNNDEITGELKGTDELVDTELKENKPLHGPPSGAIIGLH
jgi:hypothetical protein